MVADSKNMHTCEAHVFAVVQEAPARLPRLVDITDVEANKPPPTAYGARSEIANAVATVPSRRNPVKKYHRPSSLLSTLRFRFRCVRRQTRTVLLLVTASIPSNN